MVGEAIEKTVKAVRETVKGATYPARSLWNEFRDAREKFVDRFVNADKNEEKKSGVLGLGILPFPKAPEKQITPFKDIREKLMGKEKYGEQAVEEEIVPAIQ